MTRTATGVSVTMPSEPNLAPPGWYMVFVVDANGVPSAAKWVHLAGAGVTARGGYTLDGLGGVHPFASVGEALPPDATDVSYWKDWDIARGIALLPDGTGGYTLDGYGGIHPFRIGAGPMPPKVTGAPYWPGQDRARGITVLPDGSGGYIVDSTGAMSRFRIGTGRPAVPSVRSPYSPVSAPVRGLAVQRNGAAGFVLDGFGGVHGYAIAGGVPLPIAGAPYWPGWSIARGIAI